MRPPPATIPVKKTSCRRTRAGDSRQYGEKVPNPHYAMAKTTIHVVPLAASGDWEVKREGDTIALSRHPNQAEAEQAGRECAKSEDAALNVHGRMETEVKTILPSPGC